MPQRFRLANARIARILPRLHLSTLSASSIICQLMHSYLLRLRMTYRPVEALLVFLTVKRVVNLERNLALTQALTSKYIERRRQIHSKIAK
jgi:hypothetical protein